MSDRDEMYGELDYADPEADDRVLNAGEELPVGLYFLNSGEERDFDGDLTINALHEGTAGHIAD